MATPENYDLVVIGGGINGCGVARDAAGRGYSVCLFEAGDLGGGTSSGSTKLVHGGLRYLEYFEFRLVREALLEREVLWAMAPHIIRPMRFVLPHHRGLRPAAILRLGLFMYDHMGGRKLLPPTRTLDLTRDETGRALKPGFRKAFEYSDCWVEDSRLVVLNARDAAIRSAEIHPHTRVVEARRGDEGWTVTVRDEQTGRARTVLARVLVNAAGPWVDEVQKTVLGRNGVHNVRLVRGSHIVIPRRASHDRSYVFQHADGRIVFAIPYEGRYTLIGTTDEDQGDDMSPPRITDSEIDYLCAMASEYYREPVKREDIVWSYSAVRPLYDDGASKAQEATRDYVIEQEGDARTGALINVFGGKITTYRRLAEAILQKVESLLGARNPAWTAGSHLPGGDFPVGGLNQLTDDLQSSYPFLPNDLTRRLAQHYGTEARVLLGSAGALGDLGEDFGEGLYEAEIRFLSEYEWATEAEDILFRRTRLGIGMTQDQIDRVTDFVAHLAESAAPRRGKSTAS